MMDGDTTENVRAGDIDCIRVLKLGPPRTLDQVFRETLSVTERTPLRRRI